MICAKTGKACKWKFLCEKRANDALTLHPISEISTVKYEKDRSFWHFHLMPPQLFALIFHICRSLIARLSSPVYSSSYPSSASSNSLFIVVAFMKSLHVKSWKSLSRYKTNTTTHKYLSQKYPKASKSHHRYFCWHNWWSWVNFCRSHNTSNQKKAQQCELFHFSLPPFTTPTHNYPEAVFSVLSVMCREHEQIFPNINGGIFPRDLIRFNVNSIDSRVWSVKHVIR